MMWTYFKDTKLFNVKSLQQVPKKYKRKDIRMTLDYEDDFKFFKKIIEYFGDKKFGLANILSYIDANPEIKDINYYLEEKWKNNQIKKTKLVLK